MIRILRDSSGFSKTIAFGLAENQTHFEKALKLNGEKFGERQLIIKLADQREKWNKRIGINDQMYNLINPINVFI